MLSRFKLFISHNWLRLLLHFELISFHSKLTITVQELPLIILIQLLQCSRTISSSLGSWMCCNSDDSYSIQLTKLIILKLLTHGPRD